MKTNVRLSLSWLLISASVIFASVFLSNCKGHVEVFGIIDSVENCSPPFVVYFYPDAEYRSKDLEFTWDFGDGTTSHEKEPVHIYDAFDRYDVTLSIRQKEAFDSKTIALFLTEDSTAAKAEWDYASRADSLWEPAYVEFQNYSVHSTSFLWEFGTAEGDTSIEENPEFIYEEQGTYTTVLNAICNSDTSKFAREMHIKPPPSDILIDEVTIGMPSDYLGDSIWIEIWFYDDENNIGHQEGVSALVNGVQTFPVTFPMTLNLYWFNGAYNADEIIFHIWSVKNTGAPEAIFDIKTRDLQLDYYPTIIGEDNGFGFFYEALLEYRD